MRTVVSCPCGQMFATHSRFAGRNVECLTCGKPLAIPKSRWLNPVVEGGIRVLCACGWAFKAPRELEGSSVPCPGCDALILVPIQDPFGLGELPREVDSGSDPLQSSVSPLDATERWAKRTATWACGSVVLLAAALVVTAAINSFSAPSPERVSPTSELPNSSVPSTTSESRISTRERAMDTPSQL